MIDPFDVFWASLESDPLLFTADDLCRLPGGLAERLRGLKLLRLTDNATHVVCPGCEEAHVEEVMTHTGRDGMSRFFVRCPETLRVEVAEDLMRQWTVDFGVLVRRIAQAARLKGRPKEVVSGRLWRVGKTPWQGANRDVLFSRGLNWPDRGAITCHVGPNGRPIVLVPDRVPGSAVWPGTPPVIIALSDVATLNAEGLEIDASDLAARINEADKRAASLLGIPATPVEQKLAIRRQVKAEMKAQLEDDVLIAAYKQCGSYRKAALYLTKQLERPVTKDKVFGAVKRAGGSKEVLRTEDSQSVHRSVVSHRRNGKKIVRKKP